MYSQLGQEVLAVSMLWRSEADAAQGIGGVDYLMTSETDGKDLIDEVG